jgi:hypothetical protein
MITSQRTELLSRINGYYATWTRLGLSAHELLSTNVIRAIVCATPFSGGYARIVSIAKAKVGLVEPMLAVAVTKLREGPAWSYELKFDDQPLHH